MTRTQVQLPDALYARAKRITERQEMSLAELVRRGLEHMVRVYRAGDESPPAWQVPDPVATATARSTVRRGPSSKPVRRARTSPSRSSCAGRSGPRRRRGCAGPSATTPAGPSSTPRNTRGFEGFGFARVFDPVAGAA